MQGRQGADRRPADALELFVAEDDEARHARWLASVTAIADRLGDLPGVALDLRRDAAVPTLALAPKGGAAAALALYEALVSGRPCVHVDPEELGAGRLVLNPVCLAQDDPSRLSERLRALLQGGAAA